MTIQDVAMVFVYIFFIGWFCWAIGSLLWIVGCAVEQFFS